MYGFAFVTKLGTIIELYTQHYCECNAFLVSYFTRIVRMAFFRAYLEHNGMCSAVVCVPTPIRCVCFAHQSSSCM